MKEFITQLPIVEGKCPPEIDPETGKEYYPEPGTKKPVKRIICGIDVDEVLLGLQCCKTYGGCGKCPYRNNSSEGCDLKRLIGETSTVIDNLVRKVYHYREMMHDIEEILERE